MRAVLMKHGFSSEHTQRSFRNIALSPPAMFAKTCEQCHNLRLVLVGNLRGGLRTGQIFRSVDACELAMHSSEAVQFW